ncbi:MAG: M28 family peptidase, partial [Nitrososphaeraceae archaeon]|nr:M28 family peptidase [Nitrososphaeraceae archaeon]
MKYFLPFFLLFTLFSLPKIYPQDPLIQSIIEQTNADSIMHFVRELSGEVPTIIGGASYTIISRHKNQPSNDKAADYIKQKLENYGLTVYDQWFSGSGRNVYGVKPGTKYPNQKYIICAHYDDMPSGSIAPGADDNASGTAAVIEAARVFSQYNFPFTIIYALWDEEEQGLIGSDYYATNAAANGDSILGVVNLDMIAWDSNNNNIADLHTRSVGTSLYLSDKLVEVNTVYNIGLVLDIKNPGSTYSDHASFWYNNFGAILLIEDGSDFNAYYHTTNDLITHFNEPYFLKNTQAAIGTVALLSVVTGVIPVELIAFNANNSPNGIELNWITASELNNNGFEIQRSIDNQNFVTVGFVNGQGTTTETHYYSFVDFNNFTNNTTLYYRLKQIDFDGSYTYSHIVSVESISPIEFALDQNYPNPFNPTTTIKYSIANDQLVKLNIYDV